MTTSSVSTQNFFVGPAGQTEVIFDAAWADVLAAALFDLQVRVSAPQQLCTIGFERGCVEPVVAEALAAKILSPRTIEAAPVRELLLDAWLGRRPSVAPRRRI